MAETKAGAAAKTADRKSITIDFTGQEAAHEAIVAAAKADDRTPAAWLRRFLAAQHKANALK